MTSKIFDLVQVFIALLKSFLTIVAFTPVAKVPKSLLGFLS